MLQEILSDSHVSCIKSMPKNEKNFNAEGTLCPVDGVESCDNQECTCESKSTEYQAPFLDKTQIFKERRGYCIGRRAQDLLLSFICLLILWPFLLLIALIIWIDDPHGNPFFSQIRIGRDGKEFKMYKFRTMYFNAEETKEELLTQNEMNGPVFKIKDDPRITRVGRVLRRYGIDEIMQLLNVLKGDMSIVGPRPALPQEVAQYTEFQRQRLYVTPGITCYWQIQPDRNAISFEKWTELDIRYIQERSFRIDWIIILKTIQTLFRGDGE